MSVLDLCRSVQSQWKALSRLVWPEDSQQLTCAVTDRLTRDLARRYQRLIARSRRIEKVRDRLRRHQRRLDHNPTLTILREVIDRNRILLARLETAYTRQRLAFTQRKKLHKALLSGQIIVCPEPTDRDPT